ncbi:hypothetical protein [Shimia sp.]|uniref:hypothetical protein n=1 Tax=Shimia sp. TaxID=1954381 RepID=UPI0032999C92
MKSALFVPLLTGAILAGLPVQAAEITGADLIDQITGKSFDCVQGDIPLEWRFDDIAQDAKTIPYTAVVRGKTVEAEYEVTSNGRLSSDGYGAERIVERAPDGTLTVTRADGRAMTCIVQ